MFSLRDSLPSHQHQVPHTTLANPFACWNDWQRSKINNQKSQPLLCIIKWPQKVSSPVLYTAMVHRASQAIYDSAYNVCHVNRTKFSTIICFLPFGLGALNKELFLFTADPTRLSGNIHFEA